MTTLPNYPPAVELAATDMIPVWQGGSQKSATTDQVLKPGLDLMQEYVGADIQLSWAALETVIGSVDRNAVVPVDVGEHTDPVTAELVPNAGFYKWDATALAWQWISDTQAGNAATSASKAQAWAEGVEPGGSGTSSALEWAGIAKEASNQAADLVRAENIFVDVPLETAEASIAAGTYFKLVDSAAGTADVRLRTATGSDLLYTENTASALRSADPVKGAALIGLPDGSSAQDAIPRKRRTLKQMGVNYASTADQWAKLQNALTIASEDGLNLIAEPHSVYKHEGVLLFDGIELDGQGCELQALDPAYARIRATGVRPILRNLKKTSPNTVSRIGAYSSIGVLAQDATDLLLQNIIIDGGASSGILLDNVDGFHTSNTLVRNTKADAFHCTNTTKNGNVFGHVAINPGDDGFAVVSYNGDDICENIRVFGPRIRNGTARGLTVVGGRNVWFVVPDVDTTDCAGIYFSSESSYGTFGVRDCGVIGGSVKNACQRVGISQGAIHANGRAGSLTQPNGETLTNTVENIEIIGTKVRGAGAGLRAGVAFDNYAVGLISTADIQDIRVSSTYQPRGYDLGGKNIHIAGGILKNIGGTGITTNTTLSGYLRINDLTMDSVSVDGPSIMSFIYFAAAGMTGLDVAEISQVHMWKRGITIPTPINWNGLTSAQRQIKNNLLDGVKAAEPASLAKSGANYRMDLEGAMYAEGTGGVSGAESATIAAGETLSLILKPGRNIRYTWMANRQSDFSKLADITVSGGFTYSLPSGTAGVDYVVAGGGYYKLTVVSGALNSANVASQSISYDATANRVNITLTPVDALNARMQVIGVG
ncbi:right-handed parallel beta-helix repeat-containing protein [uncultured Novosphingobium sp.]|uniref:right-handed parallel beta-helix repeat-containing protein n=1 Tax=uncultured Novosphingobium sp. TaxID=292277 RepID=UPI002592787F|nr:right-handed parallel beta-helix repeat-containing protein [uncultured Novosphingobium sp.]